jgi:hypothetical protein
MKKKRVNFPTVNRDFTLLYPEPQKKIQLKIETEEFINLFVAEQLIELVEKRKLDKLKNKI